MTKEEIELMEEGYREMAEEHLAWAKMVEPMVREIWESWNDIEVIRELMEDGYTEEGTRKVLDSLKRGLGDVKAGRVSSVNLGSFAKYVT